MVITTTAVGFTLLGFGIAFCGWRFLVALRKTENSKNSKIGLLLSIFFLMGALQNIILGAGALFFSRNPNGLYSVALLSNVFLGLMAITSTAIAFYIIFPKKSVFFPVTMTGALGIALIILTILSQPRPFLTQQNGIDWGANPSLSFLMFSMFFISLVPPGYLFTSLFLRTSQRELKITSLAIALLCWGGVINVFTRLIIFQNGPTIVRTRILDIGVAIIGTCFIVAFAIVPIFKNSLLRGRRSILRDEEIR